MHRANEIVPAALAFELADPFIAAFQPTISSAKLAANNSTVFYSDHSAIAATITPTHKSTIAPSHLPPVVRAYESHWTTY
jgi:hypothetical protein